MPKYQAVKRGTRRTGAARKKSSGGLGTGRLPFDFAPGERRRLRRKTQRGHSKMLGTGKLH